MLIRPMKDVETNQCSFLIGSNWGSVSADRFMEQAYEAYRVPHNRWAPKFFVATLDGDAGIIGVTAYQRSMKMHNAFHFLWLAVHEQYQNGGAGKMLTEFRIAEIIKQGGTSIELVTQKPDYFAKFGFAVQWPQLGDGWTPMIKLLGRAGMN